MVEDNVWEYWIMQQVMIKFDGVKADNSLDTKMNSNAVFYYTTHNYSTSMYIVARTHHCNSTVMNLETTKFCGNLIRDPHPQRIYLNHVFYIKQHKSMTIIS